MSIKNVGEIAEGNVSETIDGCVRLFNKDGYPIIELYGLRDEFGNLLDDDCDIQETAKELRILWNTKVNGS